MKRVIVDISARAYDSLGRDLSGFKLIRGNTFIGDMDGDGHVAGRFGKERFCFTNLSSRELVAVMRHSVRTGFGRLTRGEVIPEWKKKRARKLNLFLNRMQKRLSNRDK